MCEANGVNVYDSFILKLIWNDETPMFKFCYKVNHQQSFLTCLVRLRAKHLY